MKITRWTAFSLEYLFTIRFGLYVQYGLNWIFIEWVCATTKYYYNDMKVLIVKKDIVPIMSSKIQLRFAIQVLVKKLNKFLKNTKK